MNVESHHHCFTFIGLCRSSKPKKYKVKSRRPLYTTSRFCLPTAFMNNSIFYQNHSGMSRLLIKLKYFCCCQTSNNCQHRC